ncbi:IclR family transcriptional regulator C-terminal domain-containing protein [Nonomuraea thailandensis]
MRRVCVAQQESPQPLRHVVRVGDELPLWAGASSKVLLIGAPEPLLVRVARSSPYGEAHVATLRAWIGQAAHDGHAASHGEREPGLSAVAVPINGPITGFAGGGTRATVAALTLSGPTVRFTGDRVREFAADLREAAERMSERGFDHPLT